MLDAAIRFAHLLAVGCWLGCYLTEAIIEVRAMRSPVQLDEATEAHAWIDRYVEIPLFSIVFLTGAWLLCTTPITPALLVKVAAAMLAIAINIICAAAVRQRAQAQASGALDQQQALSTFIRLTFLGVIPGVLALAIGINVYLSRFPQP